jgi:hypothetical protein
MRKLKLEIDALQVETFAPTAGRAGTGTVRGHLTAYYEICSPDQTGEQTCTCEPTCNADTCYNCGGTGGCGTVNEPACTSTCQPTPFTGCPKC